MLSERELERVLSLLQDRFDEVNGLFIRKVAEQIAKIGKLSQSNINLLAIMAEMTSNVREISRRLEEATGLAQRDVDEVFQQAMRETYTDPRFSRAFSREAGERSTEAKRRLEWYANNVSAQTDRAIENLSNTTAVSKAYRQAIDRAVIAASTGLTSYQAATRATVRRLGYGGLQVEYESGYHRRLDTAVRQNVIDGAKQISQQGAKLAGEVMGYDAYELSAHMRSAPDHEPVQGRVFLKAEFEKLQSGEAFEDVTGRRYAPIDRPIGEWNCRHIAVPFSTRYSRRRFTDEQLAEWAAKNREGCMIDGKKYTVYEASQLMRELETETRRWKDTANAARYAGDDTLRRQCQMHINELSAKYAQVAEAANIRPSRERMSVDGFRAVKIA